MLALLPNINQDIPHYDHAAAAVILEQHEITQGLNVAFVHINRGGHIV